MYTSTWFIVFKKYFLIKLFYSNFLYNIKKKQLLYFIFHHLYYFLLLIYLLTSISHFSFLLISSSFFTPDLTPDLSTDLSTDLSPDLPRSSRSPPVLSNTVSESCEFHVPRVPNTSGQLVYCLSDAYTNIVTWQLTHLHWHLDNVTNNSLLTLTTSQLSLTPLEFLSPWPSNLDPDCW